MAKDDYGLTVKQKAFADEYIISGNATEAAIKAGYSVKTAKSMGNENLTKPDISNYVTKRLEEIDSAKIMEQKEVMERLTRVARREEMEYTVVTLSKKEEKWVDVDGKGTLKKQTVTEEYADTVPVPAKLSDTNRALELLGKRYAMWTDKQQVDGEMDISVVVDYGDNET